ncbi:MAG: SDR family oxidoreductase [Dehalococcoidia bacterium]|nr:MAG: SDR family oxidoreductase [Dehalococcoidia bacterium]
MSEDLFDINGKIVVVTGGLGQLGRQFSLALADRGAKVAVFDQKVDEKTVAERFGSRAKDENLLFAAVDITRRGSIETALANVKKTWGVPNALINNAALDSPPGAPTSENGPFESYPESSWDSVMAVNVKGVFLCCQVIGEEMAKAQSGSIINISSMYGLVSPDQRLYEYRNKGGAPFFKPVAYSASKSALFNLTRYLATYWAAKNVRVNTLTFGGVFNDQDENFLEGYIARVPLGRMAREDEYNGAVIFLISIASSYMTGSNLVIDGGWTAW